GLLWISERDLLPEEFPPVAACGYLLLFGLTFFHPHSATWLLPLLAMTIPPHRRMLAYHGLPPPTLAVYALQWGPRTTWEVLRPSIGDRVASLPDHYEAIAARIEPRQFFGVFRSLLTAVSLWMIWKLAAPLRARRPHA